MAFLTYREAVGRIVRGDAQALSKQQISQAISFSRIVLIVGLVFLHYQQYPTVDVSPFDGMGTGPHELATFVNSFILFFFFSVVPLLSMVSGWLFFSFDADTAGASLRHRIRRRFVSLYLPMVFWDVLYLAILIPLFLWKPDYPLFADINIHFAHAGVWDYVNALFGITHHPIGFQFWFIRDLFTTVLVSPLLWLSLKRTPYLGMAFLCVAWLANSSLFIFFRTDVVFFFYLGGFLRIHRIPLHISSRTAWTLMALYVALVALRTAAPLFMDLSGSRPQLLNAATRSMRILGVVACWGVFQQLARTRLGGVIAGYGGLAFFLHSAHFPLIAEVKVLLWRVLPAQTNGWLIAHYLVSVAITVTIGLSLGLLLARKVPKVFALMNGGRPGTGPQGQEPTATAAPGVVTHVTLQESPVVPPPSRAHATVVSRVFAERMDQRLWDILAVAAAPSMLAILEIFHPHPDDLMALTVRTWLTVHYLQVPLFALSALAMARLVRARTDPFAVISRVALFVFALCFVVFDTVAGIVVGSLVQIAHASGTPEAWRAPIQALWMHPILGGTDSPILAIVGRLALSVATVAAAVSLKRAGRPWTPVVLLALSGCVMDIFHSHSWPGGPVTFGGIALAAAWLQWVRTPPTTTVPANVRPLRPVAPKHSPRSAGAVALNTHVSETKAAPSSRR
jgi:surface polysaccharide O-acyltransferase-like enzyme